MTYSGVASARDTSVTDAADLQPLMDRAEQAAQLGDFAAAEEALRLAVEFQERTLGASSPEVASTLNNLGIVYERLNRPAEAEACYRKSFAIAKAAFAGDHPLVETSATNLREFCDARGIPFEQPEPAPVSARVETPAPAPATPSRPPREEPPAPPVATSSGSSLRPIVIGAVVVLAVAAAIFFSSRRATSPVASPAPSAAAVPAAPAVEPEKPAPAPAPTSAPPAAPPAAASDPVSKGPASAVSPQAVPPRRAPNAWRLAPRWSKRSTRASASLSTSRQTGGATRCPSRSASGPVFFVTRLKSATDTSVEHRWYRNDKLSQAVTLRVGATASGYRTYSRMTASPDRPGTWRVEVGAPAARCSTRRRSSSGRPETPPSSGQGSVLPS